MVREIDRATPANDCDERDKHLLALIDDARFGRRGARLGARTIDGHDANDSVGDRPSRLVDNVEGKIVGGRAPERGEPTRDQARDQRVFHNRKG
jgi:hypothetical protein